MNINRILKSIVAAVVLCLLVSSSGLSQAEERSLVGTSFTYQGQLKVSGEPHSGTCEFKFSLYDAVTGGTQVGTTNNFTGVNVMEGFFTVLLDFGMGTFKGDARWLDIQVCCPAGTGTYQALSPRQPISPAPYALALPGLWTQQNAISPNLIGGYSGNEVAADMYGGTIGGGGQPGETCGPNNLPCWNRVTSYYGTVGGGAGNTAGYFSTVSGGYSNIASLSYSSIGGGYNNQASGNYGTISGGGPSDMSTEDSKEATKNLVTDNYGTIGGGGDNQAGNNDLALDNAIYATVSGGMSNTASAYYSSIGGGGGNTANFHGSTISGGTNNTASNNYTTIPGGKFALASNYGQQAYASGSFAEAGDAQTSEYVLRGQTTDETPINLSLDGGTRNITFRDNQAMTVDILVIALSDTGFMKGWHIEGIFSFIDGSFSKTYNATEFSPGAIPWTASCENDGNTFYIKVTGASGKTIRWVATVRTAEVAW